MTRIKMKFRLHRTAIVLICLALLVALMQGASWFSQGRLQTRNIQFEELARTLARQVSFSITPQMRAENPDEKRITAMLNILTKDSRILDASVYDNEGHLIARAGENIAVRDRLALDGKKAGSYFNQQIVEPVTDKSGPIGYVRITLDTHKLPTEAKQVDNTTNILRLMMLLALAIGIVLTRTLLQGRRTRWQQSPFLLTANKNVEEDEEDLPDTSSLKNAVARHTNTTEKTIVKKPPEPSRATKESLIIKAEVREEAAEKPPVKNRTTKNKASSSKKEVSGLSRSTDIQTQTDSAPNNQAEPDHSDSLSETEKAPAAKAKALRKEATTASPPTVKKTRKAKSKAPDNDTEPASETAIDTSKTKNKPANKTKTASASKAKVAKKSSPDIASDVTKEAGEISVSSPAAKAKTDETLSEQVPAAEAKSAGPEANSVPAADTRSDKALPEPAPVGDANSADVEADNVPAADTRPDKALPEPAPVGDANSADMEADNVPAADTRPDKALPEPAPVGDANSADVEADSVPAADTRSDKALRVSVTNTRQDETLSKPVPVNDAEPADAGSVKVSAVEKKANGRRRVVSLNKNLTSPASAEPPTAETRYSPENAPLKPTIDEENDPAEDALIRHTDNLIQHYIQEKSHAQPGIRLFISDSYDPWFNLAVEETIFRQMAPTQRVLFLWRNDDTVVIGRAQNPWKECNTRRMSEENVRLARRSSGGGAVFHDLGNICFTFMAGKPEYDKNVSTNIVINALKSLGIRVSASGRNDLEVATAGGPRKISGSAYRETFDRGFHHGTLLLNTDINRLVNYLNPDKKKLEAKGIASVRSRVANLCELQPNMGYERVCKAITEAFFAYYGEHVKAEHISLKSPPDLPGFAENFARQSDWEWNYGHAPEFSHLLDTRFDWGSVELHFDIDKGHITRAQLFTDSMNPEPLEAVASGLQGCAYRSDVLRQLCESLIETFPAQERELKEMGNWIAQATL